MFELYHKYQNWKLKNTSLLFVSLVLLFFVADTQTAKDFIFNIGQLGYISAFIVGLLCVSTFTVAPSMVILFYIAEKYDPYLVAVLAGIGAVCGDFVIYRFLRDRVFEEWKFIFERFRSEKISSIFRTPYFAWLMPVLGGLVIAVPFLPDEVGIGLIGISKLKTWQFIVASFLLNSIGIFIVVSMAQLAVQ